MAYDNTNSGALFKNQRKETDRHPDYNGNCEIACSHCGAITPMWISAWLKTAGPTAKNAGAKFFSMAFKPKEDRPQQQKEADLDNSDGNDDDVPF